MKRRFSYCMFLVMFLISSCSGEKVGGTLFEDQNVKVGLLPFGSISDAEVDSVRSAINKMYEFDVVLLETEPIPEMAYTEIRYPRYRADSLVKWISERVPDTLTMILGLSQSRHIYYKVQG